VAAMLRLLLAEFDVAILTRFLNNPRAADPDVLMQTAEQIVAEQATAGTRGESCRLITRNNSTDAWDLARSLAAGDDVICVAGSFFLASELRSLIPQEPQNR
jgi:dihydrofolate synthase / folylpolyglutamate synthase